MLIIPNMSREKEYLMSVYIRLKEMRIKKGISQEELAEKLGINRTMIIHYEKGRNQPSLERTIQIAHILNCKLDDLVDTDRYLSEYHDFLHRLSEKKTNYEVTHGN